MSFSTGCVKRINSIYIPKPIPKFKKLDWKKTTIDGKVIYYLEKEEVKKFLKNRAEIEGWTKKIEVQDDK